MLYLACQAYDIHCLIFLLFKDFGTVLYSAKDPG